MLNIFYVGKNGLEYRTASDAEIYGEGLVGKRTVGDPVFEPVTTEEIVPVEKALEDMTLEELRELAKTKGVKSSHLMGRQTLIEKLK